MSDEAKTATADAPAAEPSAARVPVMRRFKTTYWHGEVLFLRVATETRMPGIVVQVHLPPAGVTYTVGWPDGTTSDHYEMELTHEFAPDFGHGES